MRLLNLGASEGTLCGARDYATLLAGELSRLGHDIETQWLQRPLPPGSARNRLKVALAPAREGRFDAVLWHYSVFTYSHRGVPSMVWPYAMALRAIPVPVVTVLHELVYPWGHKGLTGTLWASSQRMALPAVVGVSAGLVVTVEERASWLQSRPYLPRRPVVTSPVFSNLPEVTVSRRLNGDIRIGMFGYPGSSAKLVAAALSRILGGGQPAELLLLGSPGPGSPAAAEWESAGACSGTTGALRFSGVLPPEQLASEMAGCDMLLFHDGDGPVSRKGTLAAALASGRPLVAVDGPHTWPALVAERAVRLVPPDAELLAAALIDLAGDARSREALGARGRSFYDRNQGIGVVASSIAAFIEELTSRCADAR
ncbi:MAG: hypothetical protein ACRD0Z_01285 [Acidimicrobiales bacterium]